MSGLFEHLAFNEEVDRSAARKALALARARADKRFASFIEAGERNERLSWIEADLTETVKQACADVFYDDWESVLASVQQHLGSLTVEARKPKMCPVHREITDISLQQGDPQAGFAAMAQHMFSENSCRGAWEGKCRFKPEMTTQTYWDTKAEQAEERRLERERMRAENGDNWDNEGGGQPRPEQPEPDELGGVPPSQPEEATPDDAGPPVTDDDLPTTHEGPIETDLSADDWSIDSERDMVMASTHEAEALKTVDVEQSEGPSPKMDKRKWTPENVRFLDVEMDGSPHPTRHQDIAEPAAYKSSDPGEDDGRFEQTEAVTEKQDVTKDSDYAGSGPRGQQGGSFGGGERSAVSHRIAATQVANPAIHLGTIQPLAKLHKNVPGLVVNGLPWEQFEQEARNHVGQPATVEHPVPQFEQLAAKVLEVGSEKPMVEYMATKAHNKGKHEGNPNQWCPLCQGGVEGQPQQAPVMAATDPDKNPITEFLTDEEEALALAEYRGEQ